MYLKSLQQESEDDGWEGCCPLLSTVRAFPGIAYPGVLQQVPDGSSACFLEKRASEHNSLK